VTNQCDKTIELELLPGLGEESGCRKAKEKHETRARATYRGKIGAKYSANLLKACGVHRDVNLK